MPVIGRADHDGIDVLPGKQFLVVVGGVDARRRKLGRLGQRRVPEVGESGLPLRTGSIRRGRLAHIAQTGSDTQSL